MNWEGLTNAYCISYNKTHITIYFKNHEVGNEKNILKILEIVCTTYGVNCEDRSFSFLNENTTIQL